MKWTKFYPILFLFLSAVTVNAQNTRDYRLMLKNGSFTPEKNISINKNNNLNARLSSPGQKSFVIIQFETIPSTDEKAELKERRDRTTRIHSQLRLYCYDYR